MRLNECGTLPKFVYGVKTILHFIRVEKQTLYIFDIKNRDHGQSFDDAAFNLGLLLLRTAEGK